MEMENQNTGRIERTGQSLLEFKKNCSASDFPNKFSRYVMEKGDVYFWPQGNFHVVTNAELAKEVLKSDQYSANRGEFFISRMPNLDLRLIKDFFSLVQKMMVMSDGDEHTKRRKAAFLGLEDHILDQFSEVMKTTIKKLTTEAFSKDRVDFVSDVAVKLPSTVLADLFSIPHADRENFFQWSNCMTAFFGGASEYRNEDGIQVNKAASSLRDYFQKLIEQRREKPGQDYVSHLIRSQVAFSLTDDELISQAVMMLVAGQVTTTDQINNIMYLLASNPEIQLHLKTFPEKIPQAIEEMKRFDPAVTFLFRVSKCDQFLGEQFIQRGETVFISNHAVNRDRVERPFKLDIHRKGTQHFAYGHGPHYCMGARLGRMQMQSLFETLLGECPFLKLSSENQVQRDHYSLAFSGFKKLILEPVGLS